MSRRRKADRRLAGRLIREVGPARAQAVARLRADDCREWAEHYRTTACGEDVARHEALARDADGRAESYDRVARLLGGGAR